MDIREFINILEEKGFNTNTCSRTSLDTYLKNMTLGEEVLGVLKYDLDLLKKNNFDYEEEMYDVKYFPGTISVFIHPDHSVDIECLISYPNDTFEYDEELHYAYTKKTFDEALAIIYMRMNNNPVTYEMCNPNEYYDDEDYEDDKN